MVLTRGCTLEERWKSEGILDPLVKKHEMITILSDWKNKEKPYSGEDKNAHYAYNYLEELNKRSSKFYWFDEIDKNWIQKQIQQNYDSEESLLLVTNYNLDQVRISQGDPDFKWWDIKKWAGFLAGKYLVVHDYNILRQLSKKPKASSVADIDYLWLDSIEEGIMHRKFDYMPPSEAIKSLIQEAAKIVKMERKIVPFMESDDVGGSSTLTPTGKPAIALCNNPNLDVLLSTVYHELGHVVNGDNAIRSDLKSGKKSYEEVLKEMESQPELKKIKHYTELGKTALNASTDIGKQVQEVLSHATTFWIPPKDQNEYKKTLYYLESERRADLYSLEKLYEQKHLSSIIAKIDEWLGLTKYGSPFVVIEGAETHPSHFERVLYMIGFLADKGLDVNKLIRDWETEGICRPLEVPKPG